MVDHHITKDNEDIESRTLSLSMLTKTQTKTKENSVSYVSLLSHPKALKRTAAVAKRQFKHTLSLFST